MASNGWRQGVGRELALSAGRYLAATLCLTAAAAVAARQLAELPPGYVVQSLGVFAVIAVFVIAGLPGLAPRRVFGAANGLTLSRAALVALLAGFAGREGAAEVAWALTAMAAAAFALDGVDGWWARRSGTASDFGARFDGEVDALLILVLAILVLDLGKAGPWVLLAGALRYLFIAAGMVLPALARPLPASEWRRIVCAVQTAALIACLAPWVQGAAAPMAAVGLCLLAGSFARDVFVLLRFSR